ncbi:hypothetical protein D3C87_1630240 [compost metagenome]
MGIVDAQFGVELDIARRRRAGKLGRQVDVEGAANAVHGVDHMVRPDHPADAGGGKAHLGEGADHDDVLRFAHEVEADRIIGGGDIFGIGAVDDEQDVWAEAGVEAAHFGIAEIGAGGIVGIGEPDHLGAVGDGGEKRVDIGGVVGLVHHDDFGACRHGDDRIDRKAVAVHHRLFAFAKVDLRQEV